MHIYIKYKLIKNKEIFMSFLKGIKIYFIKRFKFLHSPYSLSLLLLFLHRSLSLLLDIFFISLILNVNMVSIIDILIINCRVGEKFHHSFSFHYLRCLTATNIFAL